MKATLMLRKKVISFALALSLIAFPFSILADGIDSNTKLMIHANGANGSTSVSDSSSSAHTQTMYGSAALSTTQVKLGTAALKFTAATGDWVGSSSSSDFNFGSGDFTMDWWAYEVSNPSLPVVHISRDQNMLFAPFILSYGGGIWMSSNGSSWDVANGKTFGSPVYGAWSHIAIQRDGNTFYAIRDGVIKDKWTSSLAFPSNSGPLALGNAQFSSALMNGYLDEIRVSKGIARYNLAGLNIGDTAFAVETAEYTAPAGPPPSPGGYGAVIANVTASNQAYVDLIDTTGTPCDHYLLEFFHVVSDIETPPNASAGAVLTAYVSIDGGANFLSGPNYVTTGTSNFAGESNPTFLPQPFAFGMPQTLNMGLRLSVDSGDFPEFGATGKADIYNAGGNTIYTSTSYKGAIGGNANATRAANTYPAGSVGSAWFPTNGTQYFHWPIPISYAGHFDGAPGQRPNAFRLQMNGGGNSAAIIESGTLKLRCLD